METPDIQFKLRLPAALKTVLEESAQRAGRSLSAEIVHRLQESFESKLPSPASLYYEVEGAKSVITGGVEKMEGVRERTGDLSPFGNEDKDAALYEGWKLFLSRQVSAMDELTQFISDAGGLKEISSEEIQKKAAELKVHLVPSLKSKR